MTLLLVLKATVVFLGASGVALLYRRAPERRHQAWTLAFAASLALPLLAVVLPPLDVPVSSRWSPALPSEPLAVSSGGTPTAPSLDRFNPGEAALASPQSSSGQPNQPAILPPGNTPTVTTITAGVWLVGTGCALVMIALSLWRVRRLAASAEEVGDPSWRLSAAALAGQLGLSQPVRLLRSDQVDAPMAGGFRHPTIFLPVSSTTWDDECRDVVLAHELVHLARRDPLRHLFARLTLAMYWFHPAAWLAARWAALACEDACDDAVVRSGIRPSAYARILLELADSAGRSRTPLAALPIAQPSHLERRLVTILSHDTTRTASRRLPLAALGCAVLTVVLAAAHPIASVTGAGVATADSHALQPFDPGSPMAPTADSSLESRPPSRHTSRPESAPMPASVQRGSSRSGTASACAPDLFVGGSSERVSETLRRGGSVVGEQVEPHGYTRVIQKGFGDLRVCLFAERAGASTRPSDIVGEAARVLLEIREGGTIQQLDLRQISGASPAMEWRLNGLSAPADSTVDAWRRHLVGVLDNMWERARLHGQAKTLDVEEHDRLLTELEVRGQDELTRLRRAIAAKAPQAESADMTPPDMPEISSTLFSTPSACDLAASRASVDGSGPGSARRQPRFLRETFGDLRVCLRIDEGNVFETVRPSELMRRAGHAVLEAQRNGLVQQLELTREPDGAVRADWRVNGVSRPLNAAVDTWRTRIVDVLDTSWEIFALRGREGELLGQMSLVQERRKVNALREQIESLKVNERTAEWDSLRAGQVGEFLAAMAVIQ